MRRFFAENLDTAGDRVVISGGEAKHIRNVLRMKAGDEVLLINGEGTECLSRIISITDEAVELVITERRVCSADPEIAVSLFQCLPKQGKMELIIQKCVELGVSEIIPTVSRRCVVKLDGKDNKLVRWNKVSQEASKQCGRASVPKVASPVSMERIDLSPFDIALIAYENEDRLTLKQALKDNPSAKSIALMIGPEGGFEHVEVESILERGGMAVSLGRRILRTETAGMAALAQIMYELEV